MKTRKKHICKTEPNKTQKMLHGINTGVKCVYVELTG